MEVEDSGRSAEGRRADAVRRRGCGRRLANGRRAVRTVVGDRAGLSAWRASHRRRDGDGTSGSVRGEVCGECREVLVVAKATGAAAAAGEHCPGVSEATGLCLRQGRGAAPGRADAIRETQGQLVGDRFTTHERWPTQHTQCAVPTAQCVRCQFRCTLVAFARPVAMETWRLSSYSCTAVRLRGVCSGGSSVTVLVYVVVAARGRATRLVLRA